MTDAQVAPGRVIVRPALSGDVDFLMRMLFEAWLWNPEQPRPDYAKWRDRPYEKYVTGFLNQPGDAGVIAQIAGASVGAAWCRQLTRHEAGDRFIAGGVPEVTIAVAKDQRGRGIGKTLIQELVAQVRGDGFQTLSLHVDLDNTRACGLYHACGFVDHRPAIGGELMLLEL